MKKMIPVLIAIVLILVIAGVGFGAKLIEKYSYSDERADLQEYFGIMGEDDVPIILQDEQIEAHARIWDGICYVDLDTVYTYFNDRFYEDKEEDLLIYTMPDTVIRTEIGSSVYLTGNGESNDAGYILSRYEDGVLYIAVDYVKRYANFSYELFTDPYHMQIYTVWGERQVADINKDTQVRYQGGIKSDILTDVSKGDQVVILEEMDTWSKVKTRDSIIGYVENKRLENTRSEEQIPVTDYVEPEYASQTRGHKINLVWHAVAGPAGNDTLKPMMANTKGVNVISPTWFSLSDNEGNFTSFASKEYVNAAHEMGLEVWGLIDNFTNEDVDSYQVLAPTTSRTNLINQLIATALEYDLDGINIDFESISVEAGEPFIEFIRELSIPCRANGIVLSVDNYVPMSINDHYHREEQGIVADYVIIMGYDEHYAGSKEAGSVASINYVEDGIAHTVDRVPAGKVINAIPFYTRIWETTGSTVTSQAVDMETAGAYIANHSIETRWDEVTCQNYGEYQSGDSYYQVWLEDSESIQVKLNVMSNYGIGGVAAWRLGFEVPSIWDTIELYVNGN